MSAASDLQAAYDNMALAIRVQTANWTTAGCPPTMGIDGENYDWGDWLQKQTEGLKALAELIAATSPFEFVTHAY